MVAPGIDGGRSSMSVWETQHRLWTEQLGSLLDSKHGSRELDAEQTRRLMIAAYVVLQEHQVNKREQCWYWRSAWWPWRRKTCTVHLASRVAMKEPIGVDGGLLGTGSTQASTTGPHGKSSTSGTTSRKRRRKTKFTRSEKRRVDQFSIAALITSSRISLRRIAAGDQPTG